MISNAFAYVLPDTKEQATRAFCEYENALYYGGGSEIITMCRAGDIEPGAVIDLKAIPEANALGFEGGELVVGGCATLRAVKDSGLFPLLGAVCGRIADHTNQCRITLGGNLCSTILYRETCQALLLADADVVLYGPNGGRRESIHAVFDGRMRLSPGEFVLQARVPKACLGAPYGHVKKTSGEKIDYPLISVSTLLYGGRLRFAVSGFLGHPFRDPALEDALNDKGASKSERLENVLSRLPGPAIADYQGSAEYRRFVLKQTLAGMLEVFGV